MGRKPKYAGGTALTTMRLANDVKEDIRARGTNASSVFDTLYRKYMMSQHPQHAVAHDYAHRIDEELRLAREADEDAGARRAAAEALRGASVAELGIEAHEYIAAAERVEREREAAAEIEELRGMWTRIVGMDERRQTTLGQLGRETATLTRLQLTPDAALRLLKTGREPPVLSGVQVNTLEAHAARAAISR